MKAVGAVAVGLVLAACGGSSSKAVSTTSPQIQLSSPAFANGATIPRLFTCDGQNVSPPLTWSAPPPSTGELVIEMRDPDAPGGDFIHWSLTRIKPTTTRLAQGRVPSGAIQGHNGFGTVGYRGPCPPVGVRAHHYVITVTALAGRTVLARGTLVGTYARR
jgi:Raf kinase inhibitor-like YbhB/YbcL family protein